MNEMAIKTLAESGILGAMLIITLGASWWMLRDNRTMVSEHIKQIERINTEHDALVERINKTNLENMNKVMESHANERASWTLAVNNMTMAINNLNLSIEKRCGVQFHGNPVNQ